MDAKEGECDALERRLLQDMPQAAVVLQYFRSAMEAHRDQMLVRKMSEWVAQENVLFSGHVAATLRDLRHSCRKVSLASQPRKLACHAVDLGMGSQKDADELMDFIVLYIDGVIKKCEYLEY